MFGGGGARWVEEIFQALPKAGGKALRASDNFRSEDSPKLRVGFVGEPSGNGGSVLGQSSLDIGIPTSNSPDEIVGRSSCGERKFIFQKVSDLEIGRFGIGVMPANGSPGRQDLLGKNSVRCDARAREWSPSTNTRSKGPHSRRSDLLSSLWELPYNWVKRGRFSGLTIEPISVRPSSELLE